MGAIGDDRHPYSFAEQTLECKLRDIARAEYHCPTSTEAAEDLLGELHRRRADRRRTAPDSGFLAGARGCEQRVLEHSVEDWPRLHAAVFPRVLHLALDLRLAEDH